MENNKSQIFQRISFKGRISRRDYWIRAVKTFGAVFFSVIALSLLLPANMVETAIVVLQLTVGLYMGVMELGLAVQRLHDVGKSGKWWFINLIPFLGPLYYLYLICKKGDEGENKFGPAPGDHEAFSGKKKNFMLLKNTFEKNIEVNGMSEEKIVEILVEKGYDYNEITEAREQYKKAS